MLLPSSFVPSLRHGFANHLSTATVGGPLHSMSMMVDVTPPSTMLSTTYAVVTAIARGGGEFLASQDKSSALDISRVRMRLEGLQAYGTLCALLANGCLRLYSAVKDDTKKGKIDDNDNTTRMNQTTRFVLDAFYVLIAISVLSGSYTTVVFTLLALYSKTALGRGYDAQFLQFWAAAADLRESGFEAFLYSLVSFEIAFILSLFLKTEGKRRKIVVTLASGMALFSFWRWSKIMILASKFLFPLRAEVDY